MGEGGGGVGEVVRVRTVRRVGRWREEKVCYDAMIDMRFEYILGWEARA